MQIAAIVVDIAAVLVAGVGVLAFLRYPLNVGLIVAALNAVFLITPMFLFVHFRPPFLDYAMSSFGIIDPYADTLTAQFVTVTTAACWLAGALLAEHMRLGLPHVASPLGARPVLAPRRARLLVVACVALMVYFVGRGGFSLVEMISPSRKSIGDLYGSYWVATFLIYTPAILAALLGATRGRVGLPATSLMVFSVLVALGTGQRRTIFLLVFIMFLSVVVARATRPPAGHAQRRIRNRIVILILAVAPLGPLLWAARAYFTQLQAGAGAVTNPFAMRGFWELLFGSAATGFRTTIASLEMWQAGGVVPGYSLLYLFWAPIPRAVWPGKPIAPDGVLQEQIQLWSNPSLFVIADMVFSFYLLAPLAALIVAYLVSRPSVLMWRRVRGQASREGGAAPVSTVMLAIYVSGSLILFKNGVAPFVIFVLSTGAILALVALFAMTRGRDGGSA